MRGNIWKTDGKNPMEHERRVRLRRYIVRRLSLPNSFVLFHIDGDRPWSERHTSENAEKFQKFRVTLPQVADRGRANNPRPRVDGTAHNESRPELHLENLILICPYRSIEAWLYQNLRVALDICNREHKGAHHAKLQVLCLEKAFNLELAARGFPAREAYDVKKSFADTVDRLRSCDALVRALEFTRS
jgi:hypothetical protein